MKRRPQVLIAAILLIAAGVAWSVWKQPFGEEGIPVAGAVLAARRDARGCETWLPFAVKDCRLIVKMRPNLEGAVGKENQTFITIHRFSRGRDFAVGETLAGTCTPAGRCRFEGLEERPWALYGFLSSIAGIFLVISYLIRRRR